MTRPDTVTIRRSGRAPLLLEGFGLAAQATSLGKGARSTRWHEIELWSADLEPSGPEQRHCLVVRYRTDWDGELGYDHAEIVPRRDVARALEEFDALQRLVGYPPGEQYREKQRRLEADLLAGWEEAVADLLEAARVWELADPE